MNDSVVLINAYNREQFIDRAVKSVKNSDIATITTFPYNNCQYNIQEENKSVGFRYYKLMKEIPDYKYYFILDDDDYFKENKEKIILDKFETNKYDIEMIKEINEYLFSISTYDAFIAYKNFYNDELKLINHYHFDWHNSYYSFNLNFKKFFIKFIQEISINIYNSFDKLLYSIFKIKNCYSFPYYIYNLTYINKNRNGNHKNELLVYNTYKMFESLYNYYKNNYNFYNLYLNKFLHTNKLEYLNLIKKYIPISRYYYYKFFTKTKKGDIVE